MLGLVVLLTVPALVSAARVTVEPAARWTNIFASRPFVVRFSVGSDREFAGRAIWRLSAAGRTITRGEAPLRLSADEDTRCPVSLEAPYVKPGITLPIQLTFGVTDNQGVSSEVTKDLLVFPENPFTSQQTRLEGLHLRLFDPVGDTDEALSRLEVPFQRLRNLDAAADMPAGLLIVGEGVDWNSHRALAQLVWRLAARGTAVLCLAPSEASLPLLDGHTEALRPPESIHFDGPGVIRTLDKQLDAQSWLGKGGLVRRSIRPAISRGQLILQIGSHEHEWPWFEAEYGTSGGSLILCGFGIIENWDNAPTPRYLFLRILEYMARDRAGEIPESDRRQ